MRVPLSLGSAPAMTAGSPRRRSESHQSLEGQGRNSWAAAALVPSRPVMLHHLISFMYRASCSFHSGLDRVHVLARQEDFDSRGASLFCACLYKISYTGIFQMRPMHVLLATMLAGHYDTSVQIKSNWWSVKPQLALALRITVGPESS